MQQSIFQNNLHPLSLKSDPWFFFFFLSSQWLCFSVLWSDNQSAWRLLMKENQLRIKPPRRNFLSRSWNYGNIYLNWWLELKMTLSTWESSTFRYQSKRFAYTHTKWESREPWQTWENLPSVHSIHFLLLHTFLFRAILNQEKLQGGV